MLCQSRYVGIVIVLAALLLSSSRVLAQASLPAPAPALLQGIPTLPSPPGAAASAEASSSGSPPSPDELLSPPALPGDPSPAASPAPALVASNQSSNVSSPSAEASAPSAKPSVPSPVPVVLEKPGEAPAPLALPSVNVSNEPSSGEKTPPALVPASPAALVAPSAVSAGAGPLGLPSGPNLAELSVRVEKLQDKVAALEERLRSGPQREVPGRSISPFSYTILIGVNAITFGLVMFLLFKSRGQPVKLRAGREGGKPLANIKEYMRRYLAQGYQVPQMKTYLITQGYPKDLVERAAEELQAEGRFSA